MSQSISQLWTQGFRHEPVSQLYPGGVGDRLGPRAHALGVVSA